MRLSFGSLITHHSGQRLNHTTDSVASFRSLYVTNCSLEPEWTTSDITGGEGTSAVWYVARVADVVDIEEAELKDDPAELIDLSDPNERRKKVIQLEPGSLYELEDPIPYSKEYPQSLRYTTLEKLRSAETTEDLFD